jgi:tetratricopeptide (TPR) repeat protein
MFISDRSITFRCHPEQSEGSWFLRAVHVRYPMLESFLRKGFPVMSEADANARQKAEDHYYAALDLMADGKLEEAVAAYRESIAVDPTFTEAMHGLARALQDLQRYDEAISVAQQITALDADDVLAHTSLSVLYQKKGMIPEAEAEGAKARVLGWKQQLKKSSF